MSNIEVIRGDDITINATFKDENGTAINITGYTVFFTVKDNYTSTTDTDALISKTVTSHTNPTQGITQITISDTENNLDEGEYYYDFQLKDTSDKISSTTRGAFIVTFDITRRIS
jgi:hypothetical protein